MRLPRVVKNEVGRTELFPTLRAEEKVGAVVSVGFI